MTPSPLPVLEDSDPRLELTLGNKIPNVFVTQLEGGRHRKDARVNYLPVVTETSSKVLEAGVNTLLKTLILKKQAELDTVDQQLTLKRQEFKSRAEALARRRSELELKQQQSTESLKKFEKFVAENEVKRRRALQKYEAALELNISKQREIEDLTDQLKQLRARKQVLKERTSKHKIYEDYLMKAIDHFPSTHLDNGSESLVMPIIRRHETLTITHRELLQCLRSLEEEVEQGQPQLLIMKQEHSIKTLMANKELSELQSELETLIETNKQAEVNLLLEQDLSRQKVEEEGRLLMAINNLAEQCYLSTYGPLENMNTLTMMDMVKEYILDKADTERRVRRPMESGSAMTSRTAPTDRRESKTVKHKLKVQVKSVERVRR